LLQEPWTLSVAYTTPPCSQRRFSTYGAACTSSRSGCWPSENGVENRTLRSNASRSAELTPGLRSQSVQSLSPGVNIAGARSMFKVALASV
jgi:hypothetical protein